MDRKHCSNQGGQSLQFELENQLHSWIFNQKEIGLSISTLQIKHKAWK